jgi:hypothetical protein
MANAISRQEKIAALNTLLFLLTICSHLCQNGGMEINISQPDQDLLAKHAAAAGYDNVEQYAAKQLIALAHYGNLEFAPLNEDELNASLQMIKRGEEDIAAGRTQPMREALEEIAEQNGLNINK